MLSIANILSTGWATCRDACAAKFSSLLAYRPFLDPLPLDDYWLVLMLPLVLAIAVVYKAIKAEDVRLLPRQSAFLALQIVAFMVLAAGALWLLGLMV